jgi:recombination protein RecT
MVKNTFTQNKQPKFSVAISSDAYKNLINKTLGDPKRAQRFIAAISSAVATNPQLQACEAGSILSGALLGESLNLSPSPQLGQYYLVPYKKKQKNSDGSYGEITVATFQLGYKGYIQLAIRSGQYRHINVMPIKRGELVHFDALNEEITINLIEDELERENAETTGYYAMFEYLNGFRKAMYWSYEKMLSHADRFSQAFSAQAYENVRAGKVAEKDMWKYSSFWYKNFDDMACKTMLRQLISKWGVMSTEFQDAYEKDMSSIHEDGTYEYVDNDGTTVNTPETTVTEPEPTEQSVQTEDDAQNSFFGGEN